LDTERKLYSGQDIALTASDPFRLLLPDHRILEMQWILQQVAALKGGADVFEDESDDDGDWQAVVLSPDVEEWILSTTPSSLPDSTPPSSPPIRSHEKSTTTVATAIDFSNKAAIRSTGSAFDADLSVLLS
jgi:hypothetical protein